jgi:hypothetical protein
MIDKEALFDDYVSNLSQVIPVFEAVFQISGVCREILGTEDPFPYFDATVEGQVRDKIETSSAWTTLSELYDYAVQGVQPDGLDDGSIVINAAEILSLITTENYAPSTVWDRIVRLGDGRHAIDAGMEIGLDKLALLANVDERTVRNAISGGDLQSRKIDSVVYIDNASARSWLRGRRGYKPTKVMASANKDLADVLTSPELAAFLIDHRQQLESAASVHGRAVPTDVEAHGIRQLENGTFSLSLDSVFPLADCYQLDRGALLSCVMRIFYRDQLVMLEKAMNLSK